tara:strand:+ start:9150 stop:10673 length:1524 start_codon:yes stop_codon:yes gene_type:complete
MRFFTRRKIVAGLAGGGALASLSPYFRSGQLLSEPVGSDVAGLRPEYSTLTKYFIDPGNVTGAASDQNSGLSPESPWATLEKWRTNARAGSIGLVRECRTSISTGAIKGPLLNPENEGSSPESPIVLANYPGEVVVLDRNQNDSALVGTFNRDFIWYDGLVFDGGNRNATLGYWYGDSKPPIGCKFRHCTFQNVRLDTDDGSEGGKVSAGGKGHIYIRNGRGGVIEHCRFADISMNNPNPNLDTITAYFQEDFTFQYNVFENCATSSLYRDKNQAANDHGVSRFYRNYTAPSCTGKAFAIGDGWGSERDSKLVSTYHFDENLIAHGGIIGAERDPAEHGRFVGYRFKNNTIIGAGVFSTPGNDRGYVDIEDFEIYNNISFNSKYGWIWSGSSKSHHSLPLDKLLAIADYNAFINTEDAFKARWSRSPAPSEEYSQNEWKSLPGRPDANSVFSQRDPFRDSANFDYRLLLDSNLRGAGKSNGLASGYSVDMGCFFAEYWLPEAGPKPM